MDYVVNIFRGFMMGCADAVPGVSGGTVALILRIYDRLITAISQIDRTFLKLIAGRQFSQALKHIDFLFLATLAVGLLSGVVAMTLAVGSLFAADSSRALTLAAFFGMIMATGIVIGRLLQPTRAGLAGWTPLLLIMAISAVISGWLTTLDKSTTSDPSLAYLFCSGAIAICAMILPGISGAMIVWILGLYRYLSAIPRALIHGENIATNLLHLGVFASGCLVGLIAFSKILKWLLREYRQRTLAVLCGFIVGALLALWPFQRDLTPEAEVRHKSFETYWPSFADDNVVMVAIVAMAGFAFVLLADGYARRTAGPGLGRKAE